MKAAQKFHQDFPKVGYPARDESLAAVMELDNPFWSSLATRHHNLAQRVGEVARFPAQYAPFLSVANADVNAADALPELVGAGETVVLLGVAPRAPPGWTLQADQPLTQMVCESALADVDGPAIIALGEAHRADALALAALVYPHYFRACTTDLGRYFGIYRHGRLAAMIGERLGTAGYTEVSAICTHPDYLKRGYARRLTAMLSNNILAQGKTPFLHVSNDNHRALRLYQQIGYQQRREIPFWSMWRTK